MVASDRGYTGRVDRLEMEFCSTEQLYQDNKRLQRWDRDLVRAEVIMSIGQERSEAIFFYSKAIWELQGCESEKVKAMRRNISR